MKTPRYFSRDNTLFSCTRTLSGVRIIRNIFGLLMLFIFTILISDLLVIAGYSGTKSVWRILTEQLGVRPMDTADGSADRMIYMLLSTVICILLTLLMTRFAENRPARTLGLLKNGLAAHYLTGALSGFAAFAGAVGMAWGLGALQYAGISGEIPWKTLALLLLGWMIQGFSEEIAFRGWLMTSLGTHHGPAVTLTVSSVLFAAVHLGNDGISAMALLNLMLFGAFAGLYFMRTRNLWGCAAFHTIWNAVQGNFFGIKVSGIDAGLTVLRFDSVPGRAWLNGGDFGMEGGLAVTAVLIVGIALVWLLPEKPQRPLEV